MQQNPQYRETQPEKTGRYKGKFVHPTLWGQPESKGILYKPSLKLLKDKNELIPRKETIDIKKINQTRR